MAKVRIETDELWPFYYVSEDNRMKTEIPDDALKFIEETHEKFWIVNKYLSAVDDEDMKKAEKQLEIMRSFK